MADTQGTQLARQSPRALVKARMEAIVKALPQDTATIERFKQAAFSLAASPGIEGCEPNSVVKCIYECARLNLIPDPIQQKAHIVPFYNSRKGVKEATLIVGYKGFIELARRAEPQLFIDVGSVFTNDDYELRQGDETKLIIKRSWWEKGLEDTGELVFSWCVSAMPGQRNRTVIVPRQDGKKLAEKSKGGNKPGRPWHDNFVAMCEKTAIRRSARLWSLSPTRQDARNLMRAIEVDEAESEEMDNPADLGAGILGDIGANEPPEEGNVPMGKTDSQRHPAQVQAEQDVAQSEQQVQQERRQRKPVASRPASQSTPVAASGTQPAQQPPLALSPADEISNAKRKLGTVCDDALTRAGLGNDQTNQTTLMAYVTRNEDPAKAIHSADRAQLLIWAGSLAVMTPEEVVALFPQITKPASPAPPAASTVSEDAAEQIEQEAKEQAGDEVDAEAIIDYWKNVRGIEAGKAEKALKKLLALRYSKPFDQLTPAERKQLWEDCNAGRIKFVLFEG